MLLRLLRPHPGLVARFAIASLGRAALTAASILLIEKFLAGVLGHVQEQVQHSAEMSVLVIVGLLLLVTLGAAALSYDSQVS